MFAHSSHQSERGLRFVEAGSGLAPGFIVADRRLGMVEGAAAVRQSLVALLSTRPGERVMRPDYGCDLDALAFAPVGPTTFMLARLLVRRAIEQFEPRVQILRIDADKMAEAPEKLLLIVDYALRRTGSVANLSMTVTTRPDLAEAAP